MVETRSTNSLESFSYTGIDVKFNNLLYSQLSQLLDVQLINAGDKKEKKNIEIYETNSLDWLYMNKEKNIKYDLILVDGDHNYYTVYNELKMLENFTHDHSLIICDDYHGRYSKKDLFYIERETHKDNKWLHKPVKLERQGVGNAINDYVEQSKNKIKVSVFGNLDPCFIYNYECLNCESYNHEDTKLRDMRLKFNFNHQRGSLRE